MKKKPTDIEDEHELEILQAVAQAWHAHSSTTPIPNPKSTNEFDAHRLNFKSKPSRFKLEANSSSKSSWKYGWDFGQSLWDSYEIVSVSKKLEAGLVLDHHFSGLYEAGKIDKKRKENPNSLRNLITRASSRRFREDDIPR